MENKIRLLYAEDNTQDADLTRAHFESEAPEFQLENVQSGEQCLKRLQEGQYDILLLDYRLPDMDGIDVLRKLVQTATPVPIVMVTGQGDEELAVRTLRMGASDYVPKGSNYLWTLPSLLKNIVTEFKDKQKIGQTIAPRQRHILYVEHGQMDIDLTLKHFAETAPHFATEVTTTSRQALELLTQGRQFDLVLTDLRMPDMSGLEFIKEAKSRGIHLPFIMITGKGDEEAAVATLKLSAYDYIVKRDNYLTKLTYAIDNALARFDLQKEIAIRRQAEEDLRQSREWLEAVFEASRDGTVVEENGLIVFANKAYARLYGYSEPKELVGKQVSLIQTTEDSKQMQELASQRLRGELPPSVYEFKASRKDGTWVHLEASISTATIAGKFYLIKVVRDITERKRLEEQFRQAQKMEAIGRLAGGVAHDFNNLLTAIKGYSELLLAKLESWDPRRGDLEKIIKAGDTAARLIRQLLAFSRKQMLVPQVLDLNRQVEDLEEMLRRLISEDIELVTSLTAKPGRVKADPSQLEQVILNLAVNARDAMPQGGRLAVETANVELDETYTRRYLAARPGPYVLLAVSDSGFGMDQETQSRIFEPFFTTKDQGEGTGMGLATVYGIVKQSGGYIWVDSEPGRGATFKIYLPQVEEEVDETEVEVDQPVRSRGELLRGSETLLLVEDEEIVRSLIREILESHGYKVLEARQGSEALGTAAEYPAPIHLVLTDVIMPGLSGWELANRLTSMRPEIKVLYTSGYTDNAIARHEVLAPRTAFLQKPFTLEVLLHKVRELLDLP
jgi:PAS domain S-box-containing protein